MTRRLPPLVTFIVFAYNQEQYVRLAIEGAFSQAYEPLAIILSDDGSSDRTFAIMEEMAASYTGPHAVVARRSINNAGLSAHINDVAKNISGEFVVVAAGDDISLPGRTQALVDAWLDKGGGGTAALYSDFNPIDEHGRFASAELVGKTAPNLLEMAKGRLNTLGATSAFTKDVFDAFPPLNLDVCHEDRVLPFRAGLLGGKLIYVDEKLVNYRVTGGISRKTPKSADDFLSSYTIEHHTRIMPDAVQRLSDLRHVGRQGEIEAYCVRTIRYHRAMLALSHCKPAFYEIVLLSHLAKGADALPILKHYAKLRMRRLFRKFYPH